MPAGATYEPIATTTLSSSQTSVTLSGFSGYTDLKLVMNYIAATSASSCYSALQFNSDTGTNYSTTRIQGDGSTASSANASSVVYIDLDVSGASSTIPALVIVDLFSYSGSTNKTILGTTAIDKNGSGAVYRNVGLWRSTSAITSIKIYNRINAQSYGVGSTFTLYGIKAA